MMESCPQHTLAVVIVWLLVGVSLYSMARIFTARAEIRKLTRDDKEGK
jgi:hypothetical protein